MSAFSESIIEKFALRDTLLPKLISGVLRVKDAERFLKRMGESCIGVS